MSQAGFMIVRYVARKSAPVTGLPSLQTADSLYFIVALSGSFWISFGSASSK
jgi:hypothetical protein